MQSITVVSNETRSVGWCRGLFTPVDRPAEPAEAGVRQRYVIERMAEEVLENL